MVGGDSLVDRVLDANDDGKRGDVVRKKQRKVNDVEKNDINIFCQYK